MVMDSIVMDGVTQLDVGCCLVKGKRTKRQRPLSPLPFPAGDAAAAANHQSSPPGSSCTVEEEDMANCLILLAQGGGGHQQEEPRKLLIDSPPSPAAAVTVAERGVFVYQCKTCDRCFSSFQALGGHRASHKKPRMTEADQIDRKSSVDRKLKEEINRGEELSLSLRIVSATPPAAVKPNKVHECSICGTGFSSGQALGGHMRRHRTVVPATSAVSAVRSGLEWDLNLPAPEEGRESNKYRFVFSSSSAFPLVDCHY
ncbi:Zinc finger protein ZAT5 [Linum grandiflorum]